MKPVEELDSQASEDRCNHNVKSGQGELKNE